MSSALLFTIGSAVFAVVSTVVFLYGLALFRGFEARDLADVSADALLTIPTVETGPGTNTPRTQQATTAAANERS